MRSTAALLALTGVVLASATAFACSDDAAPPLAPAPAATSGFDSNTVEAPVDEDWSAALIGDPRISEQVVEAILPSPAKTSAALALPPAEWTVRRELGQEFEGFDFQGSGMTAGWVAWFQPPITPAAGDPLEGMYLSLAFHASAQDAERTYRYIVGVTGAQSVDGRDAIADAVSLMPGYPPEAPTVGHIVIRHRTVTASVVLLHIENRDVAAGLREFARMLALGIDEYLRAQRP